MNSIIDQTNKSAFLYASGVSGKIKKICQPLFNNFNISNFYYFRLFNDCRYLFLTSHTNAFLRKHLEEIKDEGQYFSKAITSTPYNKTRNFLWPTKLTKDPILNLLYEHDVWNGISILSRQKISSSEHFIESIGFASGKSSQNQDFLVNNTHILKQFIIYFKHLGRDSIDCTDKTKLATFKNKFDISYKPESITSKYKRKAFFNQINNIVPMAQSEQETIKLSYREIQCLKLLANGKTSKESARILDISPRTIESYIENIKIKTGCSNKSQLISIFWKHIHYNQVHNYV